VTDKTKAMIHGNHYFTDTPSGRDAVADLLSDRLSERIGS